MQRTLWSDRLDNGRIEITNHLRLKPKWLIPVYDKWIVFTKSQTLRRSTNENRIVSFLFKKNCRAYLKNHFINLCIV